MLCCALQFPNEALCPQGIPTLLKFMFCFAPPSPPEHQFKDRGHLFLHFVRCWLRDSHACRSGDSRMFVKDGQANFASAVVWPCGTASGMGAGSSRPLPSMWYLFFRTPATMTRYVVCLSLKANVRQFHIFLSRRHGEGVFGETGGAVCCHTSQQTKQADACDPTIQHAQIVNAARVSFAAVCSASFAVAMTLLALVLAALAVVQSRAGGPKLSQSSCKLQASIQY